MARATDAQPVSVHRDEELLVVDKPAGMPTTAPSEDAWSLARWVKEHYPELRAHPTSRLDSPVSGLVTFALSKRANQRLLEARRAGTYERLYVGLTLHVVEPRTGRWSWPISVDPDNPRLRVAGPGRGERTALTAYEVVERTPRACVLHLRPQTGRTHQLRVHAAKAGAPLFGDHAYGGERRLTLPDGAVVTPRRVMLHCHRVSFPWRDSRRSIESPLGADFTAILRAVLGVSEPGASRA